MHWVLSQALVVICRSHLKVQVATYQDSCQMLRKVQRVQLDEQVGD